MKFRSHLFSKKLTVLAVVIAAFVLVAPTIELFAQSSSITPKVTITGGSQSLTKETPSGLNIFTIKTAEENKALQWNCGYSTAEGLFGAVAKGVEKAASMKIENYLEVKFCKDSENVQNFLSQIKNNSSILGVLNKVNNTVLNQRPASGVQFAEEKVYAIMNPGVVYAQDPANYYPGTGFDLLQPVRSFWGWAVNFVFGFLIIIIIIIAFAIIFRQKLPGNVEVTIQSAIPNIALAMILVPLSYAISGLFIDAITIGSNVVHDFIVGPQSPGRQVYLDRNNDSASFVGTERDRGLYIDDERVNWINARSEVDLRQEVEGIGQSAGIDMGPLSIIGGLLNILDENAINDTSVTPGATSAWLGTFINAILSIIMIWIGIKIFIKLFQKYISLIFMPIISPFIFATVAVPGNGTKAVINYAKMMGASSLGFIVTYAMLLLTIVFSSSAFQATVPDFRSGLWVPPLLSLDPRIIEGVGGAGAGIGIIPFIFGLIALGIYFSIPKVLDQIDDALGAKFSIPEFIRTPIESFRESARVTGGFAFRTAPTTIARGVNIARNAPDAGRRGINYLRSGQIRDDIDRRLNIGRNATIAAEKAAGITQSTPGSAQYGLKNTYENQYSEATRRLSNANSAFVRATSDSDREKARREMQAAREDMSRVETAAANRGITLSKNEKEEEKFSMDVVFKSYMGGQDNNIVFNNEMINDILASPTGVWENTKAGKLVFTLKASEAFKFADTDILEVGPIGLRKAVYPKSNLDANTEVFDPNPTYTDPNTGESFSNIIKQLLETPPAPPFDILYVRDKTTPPGGPQNTFGGTMEFFITPDFKVASAVSGGNTTYTIQMGIRVTRALTAGGVKGLFGIPDTTSVPGKRLWSGGHISNNTKPTGKVAFRVAGTEVETDPFQLFVRIDSNS